MSFLYYPDKTIPKQLRLLIEPRTISIKSAVKHIEENIEFIKSATKDAEKENNILSYKTRGSGFYIVLPIPSSLSTNLSHTWEESETITGKLISDMFRVLSNKLGITDKIAGIIGGTSTYSPKISHYENTAPLEFSFNWKFTPKNDVEVQKIYQITKIFQIGSMPKGLANVGAVSTPFIIPPNLFNISFFGINNLKKNKHYYFKDNKIEDCVITSMNTNYTPDGDFYPFIDGTPTSLEMSITFRYSRNVSDYKKIFGIPRQTGVDNTISGKHYLNEGMTRKT